MILSTGFVVTMLNPLSKVSIRQTLINIQYSFVHKVVQHALNLNKCKLFMQLFFIFLCTDLLHYCTCMVKSFHFQAGKRSGLGVALYPGRQIHNHGIHVSPARREDIEAYA